jgi:hypothetical protein
MIKLTLAAMAVLALAGCATTSQYGNYLPSATIEQQNGFASEAVKQLAKRWPPAKTRLELKQATPDAFGIALVKGLRENGYAILEYSPKQTEDPSITEANILPLRYALDQIGSDDANIYRLTLLVGNESLTRPYIEQNGSVIPGYWTHKE